MNLKSLIVDVCVFLAVSLCTGALVVKNKVVSCGSSASATAAAPNGQAQKAN